MDTTELAARKLPANKGMLQEAISRRSGMTSRESGQMLDVILFAMEELLRTHGGLTIKGFATIRRRVRKGRDYKHPVSGAEISVPDKDTVTLTPSGALLERLAE